MHDLAIDGPRACTLAELPAAVALANSALRQGSTQSLDTDYPLVFCARNLENIRILKVNGEMAAEVPFIPWMVDFEEGTLTYGHISPTATAVNHRKKGYGLKCLRDCVARMDALGCDLSVLWTKVETFPFYESADYQAVQKQGWLSLCTREDAKAFPSQGEKVLPYDPANEHHRSAVRALHEGDRTGARRSPDAYAALLSLPQMKTLLAERDGRPVAYLVVSTAVKKPGVLEAGGDEAALETLFGRVLSELATDPVKVYTHLTSTPFSRLLERRLPGRRQLTPQGQMMRINRPRDFFAQIRRWLEKRNQGRQRAFSLSVGDETISLEFSPDGLRLGREKLPWHLVLSPRELVSAVFGQHPDRPVKIPAPLEELFPLYFSIEMLDHS